MKFNQGETNTLDIYFKIFSSISLAGCFFVLFIYLYYKHLRTVFLLLILLMQIGSSLNSISYFLPDNGDACYIQGYFNNVGKMSTVAWTSIIAYSIYYAHVTSDEQVFEFRKGYFAIGYGLPLFISGFPFITDSYGPVGGYCWLLNNYGYVWKILCFYSIVFMAIVYNCITYRLVIKEVRDSIGNLSKNTVTNQVVQKMTWRFTLYPSILVICYLSSLIKLLFEVSNEENFYLTLICGSLECLIGAVNTCVYACTPNNIEPIRMRICKCRQYTGSFSDNGLLLQEENKDSMYMRDIN
jgi:Slime mold cyclic AMP receptor